MERHHNAGQTARENYNKSGNMQQKTMTHTTMLIGNFTEPQFLILVYKNFSSTLSDNLLCLILDVAITQDDSWITINYTITIGICVLF